MTDKPRRTDTEPQMGRRSLSGRSVLGLVRTHSRGPVSNPNLCQESDQVIYRYTL
jgi:hypothetical protein